MPSSHAAEVPATTEMPSAATVPATTTTAASSERRWRKGK